MPIGLASPACIARTRTSAHISGARLLARAARATRIRACAVPRRSTPSANLPDNPLDRPDPSEPGIRLPSQAESIVGGVERKPGVTVLERDKEKSADVDYLQELLAIQQNGSKNIGFIGTRNMGFLHQQLIEILSYAMVLTGNHIYTSGGLGTNAAVVRGALRAERPDLITVILPQSLENQPEELHELLRQVEDLQCMNENDDMKLLEASRLCNSKIISNVQQIICFAFHDSKVLLQTCHEASESKTIVTLCYLD